MGYRRKTGRCIGTVVVATVALLSCANVRAGMVIDSFSDVASPNPWPVSTTVPAVLPVFETGLTGVIGGTRLTTQSAFFFDIVGLDQVQTNIVPKYGVLDYSSSVGANGDLRLAYVGDFEADLTGDLFFQIDFLGFDLGSKSPMPVKVTLGDGATTTSLTQTLTTPGAQSVLFNYSEFDGIGAVDLASINAMLIEFDPGSGGDFRIGEIKSAVPEPNTLVLLLAGAGAILRRRGV